MRLVFVFALPLFVVATNAQYSQQFRGTVTDQVLQQPLAGATVTISPLGKSVITDEAGVFRFSNIPVASYRITISYAGFKEGVLENIAVNSGKATVINVSLEAMIHTEAAVIVKAGSKKNKPLNDMSAVSARAFTVEETQKYAAAVNDPLRMATGLQVYLQLMMEITVLLFVAIHQLVYYGAWKEWIFLIKSFWYTGQQWWRHFNIKFAITFKFRFCYGCFAAEYGNALSGVFDLRLKR